MRTKNNHLSRTSGNKVATSVLVVAGVALCMTVTSCIIPVDANMDRPGYSGQYTTYQPGYRINSLPYGYRSEMISGRTYYYHDGAYFRRDQNGYVIIDAPRQSRYYGDYDRLRQARAMDRRYIR